MRLPNGYGSVHKLPGNRRRPWRARVTTGWTPEGKQLFYTVGYYATQKEALMALAAYREHPIGEKRDITLGEIYERWSEREYANLTSSTVNGYRAVWKRLSALAPHPVRNIRTSDLQTVIDDMIEEGLGRSTLEKAKTLAGILLQIAVNDDIIPTNYAKAIKLPKARKPKKETFSDLEIVALERTAAAGDVWVGTVLILIYTGLRVGELLALTPFAVDLREWTITGGLKTDAGRDRVVPIHPKIRPYIQHWMAASGPRLIHRDGRPIASTTTVGSSTTGARARGDQTTPDAACNAHTFASLLHRAGVGPKAAQDLLGHSDYATTANIYTHTRLEDLRRAVESI